MKTLNISDEQHEILKSYCFHNKMTIKDAFTTALNLLVLNNINGKKVNNTNVKVLNTTDELDFTDREAQQLIDPSLLEKFGI
jgi:hypothetical protein